jgi:hypothetical protein
LKIWEFFLDPALIMGIRNRLKLNELVSK